MFKEFYARKQAATWDRALVRFYFTVGGIAVIGALSILGAPDIVRSISFFSVPFVEEMGKAFIVAAFLAASVDVFLKKRLASEFVRDVSPFIEGIGLPSEFQEEIAFIRRMPVYRKNWHLTYRIMREDALGEEFVRTKVSCTSQVINHTEESQPFCHVSDAEYVHKQFPAPAIRAGLVINGDQKKVVSSTLNATSGHYECKIPTKLKPNADDLVCWSELDTIAEVSDADIFYLTHPTVNVTVRVEAPAELEVKVYIGHRFQEDGLNRVRQIPPPPLQTHTWQLDRAMLAWSSIYIWWTPKDPKALARSGTGAQARSAATTANAAPEKHKASLRPAE
jgi:hypothetical protein